MTIVLIRQALRDQRRAALGWGLGIVGLALLQLVIYPSIHDQAGRLQDLLDSYPQALKDLLGIGAD